MDGYIEILQDPSKQNLKVNIYRNVLQAMESGSIAPEKIEVLLKLFDKDMLLNMQYSSSILGAIKNILNRIKDGTYPEFPHLTNVAGTIFDLLAMTAPLHQVQLVQNSCLDILHSYPESCLALVVAANPQSICTLMIQYLGNANIDILIKKSILQLLLTWIKLIPDEKKGEFVNDGLSTWFSHLVPMMYVPGNGHRKLAVEAVEKILPELSKIDYENNSKWINVCNNIKDKKQYTAFMLRLYQNSDELWSRQFCCMLRLIGKELRKNGGLLNCILPVLENAFKIEKTRRESFLCWKQVMDIFVINKDINLKGIKLLTAPLVVNNAKTEEIAIVKLDVWWYLIYILKQNASIRTDLNLYPFLQFCFGCDKKKMDVIPGLVFPNVQKFSIKAAVEIFGHDDSCPGCLSEDFLKLTQPILTESLFLSCVDRWMHVMKQVTVLICKNMNQADEDTRKNLKQNARCIWVSLLKIITKPLVVPFQFSELLKVLQYLSTEAAENTELAELMVSDILPLVSEPGLGYSSAYLNDVANKDELEHTPIQSLLLLQLTESLYKKDLMDSKVYNLSNLTSAGLDGSVIDFCGWILPRLSGADHGPALWSALAEDMCCEKYTFNNDICNAVLLWLLHQEIPTKKILRVVSSWKKLFAYMCLKMASLRRNVTHLLDESILNTVLKLSEESKNSSNLLFICVLPCIIKKRLEDHPAGQVAYLSPVLEGVHRILGKVEAGEMCDVVVNGLCEMTDAVGAAISAYNIRRATPQYVQQLIRVSEAMLKSVSFMVNQKWDAGQLEVHVLKLVDTLPNFTALLFKNQLTQTVLEIISQLLKRDNTPGITSKCTAVLHQLLQKYEESSKNSTIDESAALKIQGMLGVTVSERKPFKLPAEKSDIEKEVKIKKSKSDKTKKTPEDEFVTIKPTWKFDPKKLTDHQKEVITRRRENIPALYEDLSQSQDDYSLKTWKPAGYEGASDSSKSHDQEENAAALKDSKKVNEKQADKTPIREKVNEKQVDKTPTREKVNEKQADKTPTREKVNENQVDKTPTREKVNEKQVDKTPNREKVNEKQADKTPTREKVNEKQVDKTSIREKVDDISVKKVLRNIPNPGLIESPKDLNSLPVIENLKDKNLKPKNICPVITDANIENIDIKNSPHVERPNKKSSLAARLEKSMKKLHEGAQEGISSPPASSSPNLIESERPLRTRRKPNKFDPDDARFIASPKASSSAIDDKTAFLSPRSVNADAAGDMQGSPKIPQITPTKKRKQKTRLMKELEIDTVEGHPSIEILDGSRKARRRYSVGPVPGTSQSTLTTENTIKRRRMSTIITPIEKNTESLSINDSNPVKSADNVQTEVPLNENITVSSTIKDNLTRSLSVVVVISDEENESVACSPPPPESEDVIASSQDSSVSSIKTPRRISAVINARGKNLKITNISTTPILNIPAIEIKETEEINSESLPISHNADESNAPIIVPSLKADILKDEIINISSERISQMDTSVATEADHPIKTKKPRRVSTGSKNNAPEGIQIHETITEADHPIKTKKPRRESTGSKNDAPKGIQIHETITEIGTNTKADFSIKSLKTTLRRISTECKKKPMEIEDQDEIQSRSSEATLNLDTIAKTDTSIPTDSTNFMSSEHSVDLGGTAPLSCQTLTLTDTLPLIKSKEPVKLSVKVSKRLSNVFKDISSKTVNSLSVEKNETSEKIQNSMEEIAVININCKDSSADKVETPPKIITEANEITPSKCGDNTGMSSETISEMDTLQVVSADDSSTSQIKLLVKKTSIGMITTPMDMPEEELQQDMITPDSETSLNTKEGKVEIKTTSFADLSTQQIAEANTEPVKELVSQNDKASVETVIVPDPLEDAADNAPSDVGSAPSDLIVLSDDDEECAHSAGNIMSSPLKHDLDDRNTELLNSTLDISPIKSVTFGEETTNIEDETCSVIPDLSSPEKNDCVSENTNEESPPKKRLISPKKISRPAILFSPVKSLPRSSSPDIFSGEQVSPDKEKTSVGENSPSPPRPVPAVSSPSSMLDQKKNRPLMSRANGRTAQMLGLCKMDLELIESVDKNDNMSPIRVVARKNLHNFYGNGSESSDRSKICEEENILEFSKVLPSQNASPAGPILKRLIGDDQTYSPSPSSKKKRVSFHDPPVSTSINVKKYIDPPQCIRSPQSKSKNYRDGLSFMRSPKVVKCLVKKTDNDTPHVLGIDNGLSKISQLSDNCSLVVETQQVMEIADNHLLDDSLPIYPSLCDCQTSISEIAADLSSKMWQQTFLEDVKDEINTIGDLARMTELKIQRLPLKSPKLKTAKSVLAAYEKQMNEKSPELAEDLIASVEEIPAEIIMFPSTDSVVEEIIIEIPNEETDDLAENITDTSLNDSSTVHLEMEESFQMETGEIIHITGDTLIETIEMPTLVNSLAKVPICGSVKKLKKRKLSNSPNFEAKKSRNNSPVVQPDNTPEVESYALTESLLKMSSKTCLEELSDENAIKIQQRLLQNKAAVSYLRENIADHLSNEELVSLQERLLQNPAVQQHSRDLLLTPSLFADESVLAYIQNNIDKYYKISVERRLDS